MSKTFIVGDAGGTSTQWRLVNNDVIDQFQTHGFNAFTHDIDTFAASIQASFGDKINGSASTFIYAAGVDTQEQKKEVAKGLNSVFGNLQIENDLLGVARGLSGQDAGNICILGTGSNACYYDGNEVNKVSASLGYILGDEGSGAYLGKKLLTRIFRNQLPGELISVFQDEFNLKPHEVISRLYDQPQPNHYLASFAPFIHQHRHLPEIHSIISESFEDFFDAFFHVNEHPELPFHFSGSIAYFFSDILRAVGEQRGIHIQHIVQSPIAGLVLYHQQYD